MLPPSPLTPHLSPLTSHPSPLTLGGLLQVPLHSAALTFALRRSCSTRCAFINIREQSKVPLFYDALHGQRCWFPLKSKKVCKVSYGRIQVLRNADTSA